MPPPPPNLDYAGIPVWTPRTPREAWWSLGLGIALLLLSAFTLLILLLLDQQGGFVNEFLGGIFAFLVWLVAVLGGALGIIHGLEALRVPKAKRGVANAGLALCTAIETLALAAAGYLFGFF